MISHLKKDLQDLPEGILQFHTLKCWTLLAALQDTKVLSDQPHSGAITAHLYTYPPCTGIWLSQKR